LADLFAVAASPFFNSTFLLLAILVFKFQRAE